MDSGGKGERSSGWALWAGFGFAGTEGFRSRGFFFGRGFTAFRGLVEGVERRADLLAGLDAGFVFRFGMKGTLYPGLPEIPGPRHGTGVRPVRALHDHSGLIILTILRIRHWTRNADIPVDEKPSGFEMREKRIAELLVFSLAL